MPRVDLAHVHHHAEEIVEAASSQLVVLLDVLAPGAAGVGEHVELQGELHGRVDLCGAFVAPLLVLEPLATIATR